MYLNTILKGISIHHPNNEVENEYFENHFKKTKQDAAPLMKALGRQKRYLISDKNENALTMAFEASIKVLKSNNVTPDELDMIVFVSETPEYLVPTNALILNQELGAINAHIVFDMNDNCIGMITALDYVCRYMKNNKRIRYSLIVGSLNISSMVRKDCIISYPNIADGSAAIILENKEGNIEQGFIDSNYYTNSSRRKYIVSPACGFSKLASKRVSEKKKKLNWIPHDVSFFSDEWYKLVNNLTDRNGLSPKDVDHYFFSQFSKPDAECTLDKLGLGIDKHTFIGEKYGYTGCASPFFSLHDALDSGNVKSGSTVVFCSVGAGFSMAAVLFKL